MSTVRAYVGVSTVRAYVGVSAARAWGRVCCAQGEEGSLRSRSLLLQMKRYLFSRIHLKR